MQQHNEEDFVSHPLAQIKEYGTETKMKQDESFPNYANAGGILPN